MNSYNILNKFHKNNSNQSVFFIPMSLISLHNIRIAFGGPMLLEGISLDIHKGQRTCILGRNGVGKSTLMKIIAQELSPDAGETIVAPGVQVAYLPQEVPADLSGPVYEIVASGAGRAGEKLARLHHVHEVHGSAAEMLDIQHYLSEHDGWHVQTAIDRVLDQVQLDAGLDFATLSGGMQRRALLARALVCGPEMLLLDEPTNHLDIDSISWLESFILSSQLTVMFVTHDRRFLKRIATRIIELDRGKLYDWSCDYETFLMRKQAMLDAEETAWATFDKKLAQEEVWIRRGVKARRTRNEGRVRALIALRDERRKRRQRSGAVAMAINKAGRSGNRVLDVQGISFTYNNRPIISSLTIAILRGDRIGIMGPNGSGKTTLLNLLVGRLAPQHGAIAFGANLQTVYFDQLRDQLDPEKTVWQNVAPGGGDTVFINNEPKHVISYLRDFLFTSDRAQSPVKQLSGGERNRLMLARLFTQPANLLVFDEPTNDLDAETLELLEERLQEYNGTVLVVSHDREFLNNIVTSMLVFEKEGGVKEYVGGYDDWERQKSTQKAATSLPAVIKKPAAQEAQRPAVKKLSYKESHELEALPIQIEKLDREHGDLCQAMADPSNFKKDGFIAGARLRINQIEAELNAAYSRWEMLDIRSN